MSAEDEARVAFFTAILSKPEKRRAMWVGRGEAITDQLQIADLAETPWELLPELDFWALVEGYAAAQAISLGAAFLYYLDQEPTLADGHPFLRRR